ncbi:MAG TPA: cbb3-type cytochrome c oxidase subunit I [Gammaproteobacteria bacterium]|nr:cbb3-type cytochrome c oxidase subunit I [Gammaproteobacteria bacterium]
MTVNIAFLLAMTLLISIGGLFLLIWALANDQFFVGKREARTIFAKGELGHVEDPATPKAGREAMQADQGAVGPVIDTEELDERLVLDRSSKVPTLLWIGSSVVWLLLGSIVGVLVSLKMHMPELLVDEAVLTFGRIRPAHLNLVAYGWTSMAGVGVGIWLIPRLFKTPLVGGGYAVAGGIFWNAGLLLGVIAILAGGSDGLEWLEIPWQIDILLVIGGALAAVPLLMTVVKRRVQHLYVSSWYLVAGLIWFPMLFITANVPNLFMGVEQATMNWWFAHNVLGLWMTPLGLAAAYYLIPKITGSQIYSYSLSLIGFWSLALFYSQVGVHHLIGGPVPTWLVTLSIATSIMMIIPVVAVAINHHVTVAPHWRMLLHSPTLRFVEAGALMYTLSSLQGSLMAVPYVNTVTHFTHYTIGHAHLGVYGFIGFVMFGAIYFIMPRLMNWEWPYKWAIVAHFWLVFIGIIIYFFSTSIGGWFQGEAMLDASVPFKESVEVTIPYLIARSLGGTLMTLGHIVFATHFWIALRRSGPQREGVQRLFTRGLHDKEKQS